LRIDFYTRIYYSNHFQQESILQNQVTQNQPNTVKN